MITEWREFLSAYATVAAQALGDRAKKHPPSLNPPASEQAIRAVEVQIAGELSDDYKAFLRASDGFTNFISRGNVMSCAQLQETFKLAEPFGAYETWLKEKLLFEDEIGFDIQPDQVLLVIAWGGSPNAIFLVVDPQSPHHGAVIEYAPNQKRRLDTWSSYWEETLQYFRDKAGISTSRTH